MAGNNVELITYDNVFVAIRRYLADALKVPVFVGREPNPRPVSFVMVTPSGGDDRSVIHASKSFILDCWHEADEKAAYELAERAHTYLKALRGVKDNTVFYGCEAAGGIVWLPDPDAKIPRFRQNFSTTIRGRNLT